MTARPRGRINRFGRLSGPCAAACDCLSRLGCALSARAVEQVRQTHKETWVIARPRCGAAGSSDAAAMENGTAPAEITTAIIHDDLDVVRAWLDGGGDPNALSDRSGVGTITLLSEAAWRGNIDMMHLLISRGADVDATNAEGRTALNSLLNLIDFSVHTSLPALRVLLSNGADVNLAIHKSAVHCAGKSPLMYAASVGGPGVVEMLLRAGADPKHRGNDHYGRNCNAEEYARSRANEDVNKKKSADFLRDVHLAGGWTRYFLRPHYDLLVFRALCHRRRATFDSWTPEVLVRLFGAPEARRRNNAVRGRADLPDPLFWRVLEFALGAVYDYPWIRERVRARAAAS